MSKVTLALGSFIVGACSMFLILSGNHTSISAQPVFQRTALGTDGAPTVPGLTIHLTGLTLAGNLSQPMDGLDCDKCKFSGATMEYSGGAYKLTNFSFSGPIRVNFKGAAANTLAFVALLNALAAAQQPKAPTPMKPIPQLTTISQVMSGNFESPYSGK